MYTYKLPETATQELAERVLKYTLSTNDVCLFLSTDTDHAQAGTHTHTNTGKPNAKSGCCGLVSQTTATFSLKQSPMRKAD